MPKNNNTRRNSNKRNSTRRRSSNKHVNLMANNLFKKMEAGEALWGNLMANVVVPAASASAKKANSPKAIYIENEALENYVVPDLTMRKGIWEHFPVVLEELPSTDGTQRYAVKWHRKNLKEWREARAASLDEYMEYEAYAEFRLLHSLRQFPHKYRLEAPRGRDQIVVIAMVHADDGAGAHAHRAAPVSAGPAVPHLVRLNDIKEHFPVVWHEIPGRAGTKTYEIELFGKKVREMSMAAGRNLSGDIRAQLMRALEASSSWIVLPAGGAGGGPIRIEMRVRA